MGIPRTTAGAVAITLAAARTTVACPVCAPVATRMHRGSSRTRADVPWQGQPVAVVRHARRFCCEVASGSRRIVAARCPGPAARQSRRRTRLPSLVQAMGVARGGAAGARRVADLGLSTSPDTLPRVGRPLPLPVAVVPRVLGVRRR